MLIFLEKVDFLKKSFLDKVYKWVFRRFFGFFSLFFGGLFYFPSSL